MFVGRRVGIFVIGCLVRSSAGETACGPDDHTCNSGADEVSALQVLVAVNQTSVSAHTSAGKVAPMCSDGRVCPHIFMVLADDLGWWNVPWHNPDMQPFMPISMELVRQGVELDRLYGFFGCAPSRGSLLSGRFPLNIMSQTADSLDDANFGLPIKITAFPQKLREVGYATHMVGKWHVGHASTKQLPKARGFDSFLGYFGGAEDHYTQKTEGQFRNLTDFWEENATYSGPAYQRASSAYGDQQFSEHVVQIVEAHPVAQPLFYYVAFQNPHVPLQAPSDMLEGLPEYWTESRKRYAGMVRYLDGAMRNIVEALKRRKMWQHALFVFSADNGAPSTGNNYPLNGGKAQPWEGGVRLAAFISGGFIPPAVRGTKQEGYMHLADWYATICDLAGVDSFDATAAAAGLAPLDSVSLWPLISGATFESPRQELPLYAGTVETVNVLISGRYKYLQVGRENQALWAPDCPTITVGCPGSVSVSCSDGCVHDILGDPSESFDISDEVPAIKAQMIARVAELRSSMLSYTSFDQTLIALAVMRFKYHGFVGPWLDLD